MMRDNVNKTVTNKIKSVGFLTVMYNTVNFYNN